MQDVLWTVFWVLLVLKLTALPTLTWLAVFAPIIMSFCLALIATAILGLLGPEARRQPPRNKLD